MYSRCCRMSVWDYMDQDRNHYRPHHHDHPSQEKTVYQISLSKVMMIQEVEMTGRRSGGMRLNTSGWKMACPTMSK